VLLNFLLLESQNKKKQHMKKRLLSALLGLALCGGSFAQVSEGGMPTTFVKHTVDASDPFDFPYEVIELHAPNVAAAQAEDAENDQKGAYRVGLNTATNVNILNSGTWMELGNGDKIWRVGIKSQGAKALTLYFADAVEIPFGGRLHAYNVKQSQYIGAFTSSTPSFQAMEMIQGEIVTLEYYQPYGSALPTFQVSEIAHIYRGVGERIQYFEQGYSQNQYKAQSCEVDVACSEIVGWEDQRDAVVRYTFVDGGTFLCSGSVINNTNNDCTPYILSANHCGEPVNNGDITGHVWYFNYQRPTCSPGNTTPYSGAQSETMSGGTFRASSSLGNEPAGGVNEVDGCDFVLVEMNSAIPQSYGAYYAGWNRGASASGSGVGIHHPSGDEKKISTYTSSLSSATYNGGWSSAHWLVTWAATANGHGVTEGGSSGSPIFNNSGHIVGHLSGGSSFCTSTGSPDLYGKFRNAWDMEGGNANQQLKTWLDPGNAGSTSIAGTFSPCGPVAPIADFIADQTSVAPATTVSFTDQSSGVPTSWAWAVTPATGWTYTGGTNASSQNPQIIFNTLGFYTIALTATNGNGNDNETKTDYIEVVTGGGGGGPCAAEGTSDCSNGTASEYISNVTLETISNATGCSGYTDYTSMSASLDIGSPYTVTVEPGVAGTGAGQAYTDDEISAWIDWNNDGDFDDAGEQVGYVIVATAFSSAFDFTVPASAVAGDVTMRCRISYFPDDGAIVPCGTTQWGEVEDYTITIVDPSSGIIEDDLNDLIIYPNPTNGDVVVNFSNVQSQIESVELRDITGRIIAKTSSVSGNVKFDLSNEASGVYFIKVNGEGTTLTKKVIRF
jgi:lysyl endopeptidase